MTRSFECARTFHVLLNSNLKKRLIMKIDSRDEKIRMDRVNKRLRRRITSLEPPCLDKIRSTCTFFKNYADDSIGVILEDLLLKKNEYERKSLFY